MYRNAQFGIRKLDTSSIIWCETYFDIMNHLGITHKCDSRIDRRTDTLTANAVCHYVTWPMTDKLQKFIKAFQYLHKSIQSTNSEEIKNIII